MEQTPTDNSTILLDQVIHKLIENQEKLEEKTSCLEIPDEVPAPPPSPSLEVFSHDVFYGNGENPYGDVEIETDYLQENGLEFAPGNQNPFTVFGQMAQLSEIPLGRSCNTLFYPCDNVIWPSNRVGGLNRGRQDILILDIDWCKWIPKLLGLLGIVASTIIICLIYIYPKAKP